MSAVIEWNEAQKANRKEKSADRIRDVANWWTDSLYVSSQPWVTRKQGVVLHGVITRSELTTVAVGGNGERLLQYSSIEELVETWDAD